MADSCAIKKTEGPVTDCPAAEETTELECSCPNDMESQAAELIVTTAEYEGSISISDICNTELEFLSALLIWALYFSGHLILVQNIYANQSEAKFKCSPLKS